MIYIVVFAMSILSIKIADVYFKKQKKTYKMWILFSIMLPALLAACRSDTIGTDVKVYVRPLFQMAENSANIIDYLNNNVVRFLGSDILYIVQTYIVTALFKKIFFVHLINQIFITVPIVYAIWKNKENISPAMSMSVYMFVFYCNNYNTVRQNIAMSIVLLAIIFLWENKKILCIMFVFFAIGYHRSAIIGFGLILIYYLLSKKISNLYKSIMIILTLTLALYYDVIFNFIINVIPILPQRYATEKYLYANSYNFPITDFVLLFVALCLAILVRINKKNNLQVEFLELISIISFIGIFIAARARFAHRIFWYFQIFIIFVLPQGGCILKQNKVNRILYKSFFMVFIVSYWVIYFAVLKSAEVFPYEFAQPIF